MNDENSVVDCGWDQILSSITGLDDVVDDSIDPHKSFSTFELLFVICEETGVSLNESHTLPVVTLEIGSTLFTFSSNLFSSPLSND